MPYNRLNRIYASMKQRCCYPKCPNYKYYGERGITVCKEWLDEEIVKHPNTKGWLAFKKWALESGYKDDLTIDRIDVNKGYSQRETTEASFRYKYWVISGHKTECDVIAWCEIPTFDKEK